MWGMAARRRSALRCGDSARFGACGNVVELGPKTHVWKRSALLENSRQSHRRSGPLRQGRGLSVERHCERRQISEGIARDINIGAEAAKSHRRIFRGNARSGGHCGVS